MKKSTLFITALLTTFCLAAIFGAVTVWQYVSSAQITVVIDFEIAEDNQGDLYVDNEVVGTIEYDPIKGWVQIKSSDGTVIDESALIEGDHILLHMPYEDKVVAVEAITNEKTLFYAQKVMSIKEWEVLKAGYDNDKK